MSKRGDSNIGDHHASGQDTVDADTFERAMADVKRVPADPRGRVHLTAPAIGAGGSTSKGRADRKTASTHEPRQADQDVDLDFASHGVDRREIRKLKRGEYRVCAREDLHGMTVAQARRAVPHFIANSRHRGHRCVCIVHGRGLHSAGGASKLKTHVREWLRADDSVLAYADAPLADGGPGAVYVLLRR